MIFDEIPNYVDMLLDAAASYRDNLANRVFLICSVPSRNIWSPVRCAAVYFSGPHFLHLTGMSLPYHEGAFNIESTYAANFYKSLIYRQTLIRSNKKLTNKRIESVLTKGDITKRKIALGKIQAIRDIASHLEEMKHVGLYSQAEHQKQCMTNSLLHTELILGSHRASIGFVKSSYVGVDGVPYTPNTLMDNSIYNLTAIRSRVQYIISGRKRFEENINEIQFDKLVMLNDRLLKESRRASPELPQNLNISNEVIDQIEERIECHKHDLSPQPYVYLEGPQPVW